MDYAKFLSLAERFRTYGFHLYIVGGSARDYLLHHDTFDMDLASDASPEDLIKIIPEGNLAFIKYGVIQIKDESHHIDIACFRIENDYEDYRHPKTIAFTTSIQEDSKRRDFTINALYIDEEGKVYDFYDGLDDLNKGIIKMIGDPFKRFKEDPLRILRCLRFALTLDFKIEEKTLEALKISLPLLEYLNPQKIKEEIKKMEAISKSKTEEILKKYHLDF